MAENKEKIAVIGGGQIGEALISGLVASGYAPGAIVATNRRTERGQQLHERYGIETTTDNHAAVAGARYVFLCVKPYAIIEVLEDLADSLTTSTVVVSMAAGMTLAKMEAAVPAGVPVVRVMPNTPMLVRKGMNACAPGTHATEEHMAGVTELLSSVGEVEVLEEKHLNAASALAGSAPAYFFLVTEALIDAGVALGLTRDVATKLATTTAAGAGAMLVESGKDPVTLRANVSSPGGTTVASIRELEESGIRGAFYRATEANKRRGEELG